MPHAPLVPSLVSPCPHSPLPTHTPASSGPITTLFPSECPPIRSLFRDPKGSPAITVFHPLQTTFSVFLGPSRLHTHNPIHSAWQFVPKADMLVLVGLDPHHHLLTDRNWMFIGSLDVTESGKVHAFSLISSCLGSRRVGSRREPRGLNRDHNMV